MEVLQLQHQRCEASNEKMLEEYFLPALANLVRQSSIIIPKIHVEIYQPTFIITVIGNVLSLDEDQIKPKNLLQEYYRDDRELRGVTSVIGTHDEIMLLTNDASVIFLSNVSSHLKIYHIEIYDIKDVMNRVRKRTCSRSRYGLDRRWYSLIDC